MSFSTPFVDGVCQARPSSVIIDCQHMSRETLGYVMAQGLEHSLASDHGQTLKERCIGRIVLPRDRDEIHEDVYRTVKRDFK